MPASVRDLSTNSSIIPPIYLSFIESETPLVSSIIPGVKEVRKGRGGPTNAKNVNE
jgi:hypothetical protein